MLSGKSRGAYFTFVYSSVASLMLMDVGLVPGIT